MKIVLLKKIWKAGTNTRVITINKNFCDFHKLDYGDYVQVTIEPVKKKSLS